MKIGYYLAAGGELGFILWAIFITIFSLKKAIEKGIKLSEFSFSILFNDKPLNQETGIKLLIYAIFGLIATVGLIMIDPGHIFH